MLEGRSNSQLVYICVYVQYMYIHVGCTVYFIHAVGLVAHIGVCEWRGRGRGRGSGSVMYVCISMYLYNYKIIMHY